MPDTRGLCASLPQIDSRPLMLSDSGPAICRGASIKNNDVGHAVNQGVHQPSSLTFSSMPARRGPCNQNPH